MLSSVLAILACVAPQPSGTPSLADPKLGTSADTGETPLFAFDGGVPKNIIMISIDTMAKPRVGRYSGLDTTPFLDAKMDEAVVFEGHRSCSNWTLPSMVCVQTGATPFSQGFFPWSSDSNVPDIPSSLDTLAVALDGAGFNTTLVAGNDVVTAYGALRAGFDTVDYVSWYGAKDVAARAIRRATELAGKPAPFYLWVHFIDPHKPYIAPSRYSSELKGLVPIGFDASLPPEVFGIQSAYPSRSKTWQAVADQHLATVYEAEYEYVDEEIKRMWAAMDAAGALDDTLVVFFTDHGEQFYEHAGWNHGSALYIEENGATSFMWAKNLEPASWYGVTSHYDLAPTLYDMYGLSPEAQHMGEVIGTQAADRSVVGQNYWAGLSMFLTLVKGDTQLMYRWNGTGKEFYDLAADPAMTTDIYDPKLAGVVDAWADLEPHVYDIYADFPHFGAPKNVGP